MDGTPKERKEDIRAEYEAEFDADPKPDALANADVAETLALLGPSPRSQIQKIQLEFNKKIREANGEVAEMMEREVHLKEQNRILQIQNEKLGKDRDYWKDLKDPDEVNRELREELWKTQTLLQDAQNKLMHKPGLVLPSVPIQVQDKPAPEVKKPWWKLFQ